MFFLKRRLVMTGPLAGAASLATLNALRAHDGGILSGALEGLEDFWLATDAYIYGYPLVTMEMTRRVMTNVA